MLKKDFNRKRYKDAEAEHEDAETENLATWFQCLVDATPKRTPPEIVVALLKKPMDLWHGMCASKGNEKALMSGGKEGLEESLVLLLQMNSQPQILHLDYDGITKNLFGTVEFHLNNFAEYDAESINTPTEVRFGHDATKDPCDHPWNELPCFITGNVRNPEVMYWSNNPHRGPEVLLPAGKARFAFLQTFATPRTSPDGQVVWETFALEACCDELEKKAPQDKKYNHSAYVEHGDLIMSELLTEA